MDQAAGTSLRGELVSVITIEFYSLVGLHIDLIFCEKEKLRSAPPTEDEWWTETSCESNDSQDCSDSEGVEVAVNSSSSETRRFHNCGLETWLRARKEWNKRTIETLPPKPAPAEYNKLARGLMKHSTQRTYELPSQMALSDLIGVYTDIWEGIGM